MSMWLATIFAQALTLSLEDSTALRAQLTDQRASVDVETTPGFTLELKQPRVVWTLGYHPSVFVSDVAHHSLADPSVRHSFGVTAATGFRRTSLTLAQSGTYGEQNLRVPPVLGPGPEPLAPEPDPAAEMPPGVAPGPAVPMSPPAPIVIIPALNQTIRYGSSSTSLGVGHVLSERFTLSESVAYSASSGLNAESRALYPRQDTASLSLSLGSVISRRDGLLSTLGTSLTTTASTDIFIHTISEHWSHRFSPRAAGSLGAGVAYTRSEGSEGRSESVLPVADAGITILHQRRRVVHSLSFSANLAPQVDRASGGIDTRTGWAVTGVRTAGRLTLALSSTGATSLDAGSPRKFIAIGAAFGANYALTSEFAVGANVDGTWQDFAGAPRAAPLFFGALYFTYRMRPEPL